MFPQIADLHPVVTNRRDTFVVSNLIRYPRFRLSVSGVFQCAAFAFGVLADMNAFYRYTGNSAHLSHPPVRQYRTRPPS